MTVRVVIADDHRLLLEGLAEALSSLPDIELVGTAVDAARTEEVLRATRPDALLLDLEMPGGGLSVLRSEQRTPPTIVVTMHHDDDHLRRAEAAGAMAFLSKSTPLPELAAAVRAVAAGEDLIRCDDPIAVLARYRAPRLVGGAAELTVRERELLRLLARGISRTEDLAEELFISQKTVKNHLANIYEKLRVSDRAQAAVEAIRLGLHR